MNNNNKYLLKFVSTGDASRIHSQEWITSQLEIQLKMAEWCKERLGEAGFPRWQFSSHYIFTKDFITYDTIEIEIADGIYIFDEEARTAFKLTFEL